jgi:HPt (histidine-containing phosphotransfer) domain-containing protein
MIKNESERKIENVCNLGYLSDTMGGKKHLIEEIIDIFLKQIPEELQTINEAIEKTNYPVIKSFAHTMKSTVSIMGISVLTPILLEMENLGAKATDIERIKELNLKLTLICKQAIAEIEREKHKMLNTKN